MALQFQEGDAIELFLGNMKGDEVWAPGKLIRVNKDSNELSTYDVICDGFGEAQHCPRNVVRRKQDQASEGAAKPPAPVETPWEVLLISLLRVFDQREISHVTPSL
jgi:hypothetical protein